MKTITIGKLRGLQQSTSAQGTFTCLALDHRQNLRRALSPCDPSLVTDTTLSEFKQDVMSALAEHATAVLVDPEVSAAQAIASGSLPGRVGLVVALEIDRLRWVTYSPDEQVTTQLECRKSQTHGSQHGQAAGLLSP